MEGTDPRHSSFGFVFDDERAPYQRQRGAAAVKPWAEQASGAEAAVVAQAAIRAAEILDIGPAALAKILGLSQAGAARLRDGRFDLATAGGPFARAAPLVRVFVALDAITGGDEQATRAWLRAFNIALRDTPLELMQAPGGLAQVALHLEGRLGRV